MNPIKKLIAYLRWRSAVDMAERNSSENRCRYYVVPFPRNGKAPGLMVTDRKNFRKLRHKNYVGRDIDMNTLLSTCIYHTAKGDGTGAMYPYEVKYRKELWYKVYTERH